MPPRGFPGNLFWVFWPLFGPFLGPGDGLGSAPTNKRTPLLAPPLATFIRALGARGVPGNFTKKYFWQLSKGTKLPEPARTRQKLPGNITKMTPLSHRSPATFSGNITKNHSGNFHGDKVARTSRPVPGWLRPASGGESCQRALGFIGRCRTRAGISG